MTDKRTCQKKIQYLLDSFKEDSVIDFNKSDLDIAYDDSACEWGLSLKVRISTGSYSDCYPDGYKTFSIGSEKDLAGLKKHLISLQDIAHKKQSTAPNAELVLQKLKDFQRTTAEYVFKKLYDDNHRRFLVADEVGLGKTLVARGIIAKAVQSLWDKKEADGQTPLRIDIVYICSNTSIARQNINKLTIPGITGHVEPTRITMLAEAVTQFNPRLNFIALTPGTSFDVASGTGWVKERALLYVLLKKVWGLRECDRNTNFFSDGASSERFDWEVEEVLANADTKLNKEIMEHFQDRLATEGATLADEYYGMISAFGRHNYKRCSIEKRRKRRDFIARLRKLLASASISVLKPDLVILDEFQRFRDILGDPNEDGISDALADIRELAHYLFNQKTAKILLLSATPYKMYTVYDDVEGADHYQDFIHTVKFLFENDKQKTEEFEKYLHGYRNAILKSDSFAGNELVLLKDNIERILRSIMVRTERFYYIKDKGGLVDDGKGTKRDVCDFLTNDIKSYTALRKVSDQIALGHMLEYWKSAPYLFNFMEQYLCKNAFDEMLSKPKAAYTKFDGDVGDLLSFNDIAQYQKVTISNGKLRRLVEHKIGGEDTGPWQLLWIPATIPYWNPEGVFAGQEFTKALIFSNWKVVPKAISLLASYEAERRIFKDSGVQYFQDKRAIPPFVFAKKEGSGEGGSVSLTRMTNFTILYPSFTLAKLVQPFQLCADLKKKGVEPSIDNIISEIALILQKQYQHVIDAKRKAGETSREDTRWHWALPVLLDKENPEINNQLRNFYNQKTDAYYPEDDTDSQRESDIFREYLDECYSISFDKLGEVPKDIWTVLAKISLGSPSVIFLRSLLNRWRSVETYCLDAMFNEAAKVGMAFRSLFNQPESIRIIRGDASEDAYWLATLNYSINGNLQAVIDEYLHVLVDVEGLNMLPPIPAIKGLSEKIQTAVSLMTSTGRVDDIGIRHNEKQIVRADEKRAMRYHYAVPFGMQTEHADRGDRDDKVRTAFNSPFKPFILTSTSIGQEGLDFHLYCHEIYHWNLPSNPIDLEQREGRINRYKGHLIRKNARDMMSGMTQIDYSQDLWEQIFRYLDEKRRKEQTGQCEMIPYWIIEAGKNKIIRHVLTLPMGKDIQKYKSVKNTLVSYRLVFGQPRQEDLIEYLENVHENIICDEKLLSRFLINLCPLIFTKPNGINNT